VIARKRKKQMVSERLTSLGRDVYAQILCGDFPSVRMPSRSIQNIEYHPELRQYVLGEKSVRRSTRNIRHLRPFTQLVWTAYIAETLCSMGKTSTLRDVYYMAQSDDVHFNDQAESDDTITDLETITGYAREDFSIFPEERSSIFGDLTIEYTVPGYEGRRLTLTSHPDGLVIGPTLTSSEFVSCNADKVIVIEKGAMFTRLVEENAPQRFKALLIQTAGQPPRATRHLIRRLNQELALPVYIFTDADPWGMHIAMVIISGSANAAHLRELATPDAVWSGVWASDIVRYKLPSDPLTELDVKRLYELKKDPRYEGKLWRRETELFLKNRRKSEQEAFSRYGLTYIVDEYLPEKLTRQTKLL